MNSMPPAGSPHRRGMPPPLLGPSSSSAFTAAADGDHDAAVSQHAYVTLKQWWLATAEGDDQERKIAVAGIMQKNETLYTSAPIATCYSPRLLETEDQAVINICGLFSVPESYKNGYSYTDANEFRNGFPDSWQSYKAQPKSDIECQPCSSNASNSGGDYTQFYLEMLCRGLHVMSCADEFLKSNSHKDAVFQKSSHLLNARPRIEEYVDDDITKNENAAASSEAATAAGEVALVGAGTGDGGASASAVLPQPSDVAEASPVVQTQPPSAAKASPVAQKPKSFNASEASPVVQTQPSNAAETSPVVQTPKSSNVAEASPVVQTQPSDVAEASPVVQTPKSTTFAEASPMAQMQKPATDAEGSVPATMPATAEPSASSPKPRPKPNPSHADADADAAAAISACKAKGKGVGADNSSSDGRKRGRGGKGKEVVEDGGSKGKEEGKKSVGKKEERGDRKIAGFIFMRNAKTKKECYQNRVFGMPSGKIEMVKKIRPGVKLFLYDFDLKLLYGVYKAASHGGLNLVQGACNGKFPSQVKFKIDEDCRPLPKSSLKQAISARSKFKLELTARQVQRLLSLFKPVSAPQSVPNNRRGQRRHYEERRKPYHHFEERRPSLPIEELRQPLFDEERRPAVRHVPLEDPYRAPLFAPVQGDHHRYYQPLALAPEPRHIPLVLEPRYVPAAYYRTLAPSGDSYYRSVENLVPGRYADRTVADVTTRDPIIRDHTALPGEASAQAGRFDDLYRTRGAHVEELYSPGEIAAHANRVGIATRADRVEELYRSDRPVNHAVEPPHSAYLSAAYDTNPAYAETSIRPVSGRVSGPGVPISSHYPFTGGPVYW